MVQVETGVSGQVQLLKLGRQILWQSDLTQLVTAQIHTLKRYKYIYEYSQTCTYKHELCITAHEDAQSGAVTTVLLSSPSAA